MTDDIIQNEADWIALDRTRASEKLELSEVVDDRLFVNDEPAVNEDTEES